MTGLHFDNQTVLTFVSRLIIALCSFPIHESAHAWTAWKLGDPTGKNAGRISLNPIKHLDIWGTITIFLFGFGYAKPVPVNARHFKNQKLYFAITALAGPASNLVMAIILMLAKRLLYSLGAGSTTLNWCLSFASFINISLAIFNLIPIPPLDGSRIIMAFLPNHMYSPLMKYERYSMYAIWMILLLCNRIGVSPIASASHYLYGMLSQIIG